MHTKLGMPLIGAGIVAIIGLLTIPANFWLGATICLLAGVGAIYASTRARTRKIPPMQMDLSDFQREEHINQWLRSGVQDESKVLKALIRPLRTADLDPRMPLLENDEGQSVLTTYEVLAEIVAIADAHRLPSEELIRDITKIYPRIEANLTSAILQYPDDLELITLWLANRSLKDIRKELDMK